MAGGGHLEGYIRAIPAYLPDYQVHLIDLVGHGFSSKSDKGLLIPDFAAHVLGYLDTVGIDRAHLVGLSLGGWVAAWVASDHPERVRSLTLISAAGNPTGGPARDPGVGERLRAGTANAASKDKSKTRKRLETVIHDPAMVTDELVDIRFDIYHRPDFIAQLPHMGALSFPETYVKYSLTPERLARIKVETLLIWGEEDEGAGVDKADFLEAGIAKTKLVTFKNVGHWAPYERTADFTRIHKAYMQHGLDAVQAGPQ